MNNSDWRKGDFDNYFSHHLLVTHLGETHPRFHVLMNPDGEGWTIGIFFPFIGEYAPLEEEDEDRLVFSTSDEAKAYVDSNLRNY